MDADKLRWLEEARSRLYINGFLSESENSKVEGRIKKACDKAGMTVVKRSIFAAPLPQPPKENDQ